MTTRASYLIAVSDDADPAQAARDQIDWNPEWSRRGRGVPVYAAIRALGREGVRGIVERCSDHARRLVAEIGALPGPRRLSSHSSTRG
jgi:glutamate/tyrosine decarboxylase-like PLP-dependent enzyme